MEEGALTGMRIRSLTIADLDAVVEIERKILGRIRPDYWEAKIEAPNAKLPLCCLAAELEGRVIGFMVGEVSGLEFGIPETIGWISTIGVDPAYQHKGVARKLSREFVGNMKSIGVKVVYTLVNWSDWDLLKFFRAMGFTRGGEMINLQLNIE
jgi:ribosomal protein S18 acetylase RimI-like enzyme